MQQLGTAEFLKQNGVESKILNKISEGENSIISYIQSGKISFIINTPTKGKESTRDGFKIRRVATECKIPCFTSIDTANALYEAIENSKKEEELEIVDITKI